MFRRPTLRDALPAKVDHAPGDALTLAASVDASNASEVTAKILAVGLAAIHERLGDMWIWDKAINR